MKIFLIQFLLSSILAPTVLAEGKKGQQLKSAKATSPCSSKKGCQEGIAKLDSDLQKKLDETLNGLKAKKIFYQPSAPQDIRILFEAVSAIYRPTGEELGIQKFIEGVFHLAESQWPAQSRKDLKFILEKGTGNIVILVPGTGRFKTAASVALQAHMDMVTIIEGPSDNPKENFRKGVLIEEKDGWLQSKDQKTSLGADNGVGLAMALRYLDPSLEHPPLEVVFTVHEEIGLKGASQFKYPLKSKILISLDGMIAEDVPGLIYGSSGTNRTAVQGEFSRTKSAADMKLVEIQVRNFKGGHSGNDIHRPRWNAVKAFAQMAEFLMKSYPGSTLQYAISNREDAINAIPSSFLSRIAIPRSVDVNEFAFATKKFILDTIKSGNYTDEILKDEDIKVQVVPTEARSRVLEIADSTSILEALNKAPHGRVHQDPEFPNKMRTSSNLGYVKIDVNEKGKANFESAFMVRSFVDSEMETLVQDSVKALSQAFPKEKTQVRKISGYSPWLESKESPLIVYLMKEMPFFKKLHLLPVGLEPSYFKKQFPHLQIVGLSPDLRDAHSVTERVHLESLFQVTKALNEVLVKLGEKNPAESLTQ